MKGPHMTDGNPPDDAVENLRSWMKNIDLGREPRGTWLPDVDVRDQVWRLERKNEVLVSHIERLILKVEALERSAGETSA